MKRVYLFTYLFMILALVVIAAAAASADTNNSCSSSCYVTSGGGVSCPSCPSGGWNRAPIYVVPEGRGPCVSPVCPPNAVLVDPWSQCGAFCYAGQAPQGWPYGWCDQYWLRPSSNF